MKKMHSVSVRVHVLLLLMGILIAATLITSASVTNSRQVDDFLKTKPPRPPRPSRRMWTPTWFHA